MELTDRLVRFLRPGSLFSLDSGLWVVDAFQPVAAIVDPASGALLDVVSWPELPPAAASPVWPQPVVMSDGQSLWVQQEPSGPLLRIGPDGDRTAAWTDELELAVCGPGEAWCMPPLPRQELVQGPDAQPAALADLGFSRLLRVRADGRQESLMVDRPIRALHATASALVVEVDDDPWRLAHLGVNTYQVVRTSRYLSLPWGTVLPDQLTVTTAASSEHRPADVRRAPSNLAMSWYEQTDDPRAALHAVGLRWRLGRTWESTPEDHAPYLPVIATAHDDAGNLVRRFELGPGEVVTARAIADDTAVGVAVARRGPTYPAEVLLLRPHENRITTLLDVDAVEITDRCWPLVRRPIEADSYAAQVLASNSSIHEYWHGDDGVQPLVEGMSEVTTRLDGQWPHTHLEWTFRWNQRPGVLIRRRVPLYDELGRPSPPRSADISLMEALHTRSMPITAGHGVFDLY